MKQKLIQILLVFSLFVFQQKLHAQDAVLTTGGINSGSYTIGKMSYHIQTNTSQTCTNGFTKWNGTSWTNGIPNLTISAIIDANYTAGSFSACELIINSGFSVNIAAAEYVEVENNLINKGSIVIANQASFVQNMDVALVKGSGNYSTEIITTSLADDDRFTYFSSPVEGQDLSVFSAWANTDRMWSFDQAIQDWLLVDSATIMDPTNGFAIKPSTSSTFPFNAVTTFNKKFNNGIFTHSLTFNTGGIDDDNALVGNPYPSAISAADLLTNNPSANAFYFWTHKSVLTGTGYAGDDYAIWNSSGGIASSSGSPAPSGFIASGQGFFATSVSNGDLTFNNSLRVLDQNDDFRTLQNTNDDKIWINMTDANATTSQDLFKQILIAFSDGASTAFDPKLDATRFRVGNPMSFYTNGLNNERFAIETRGLLTTNATIPLGFEVLDPSITNLKITIDHFEHLEEVTVYLRDNLLANTHNLSENDYEFSPTITGEINNRFELIFERNPLAINEQELKDELLVYNQSETEIKVKMQNGSIIKEFVAFDVVGKIIIDVKANNNDFIINTNLGQGQLLFIKATLENGKIFTKKFIKL